MGTRGLEHPLDETLTRQWKLRVGNKTEPDEGELIARGL